jgi:hypothetical protein
MLVFPPVNGLHEIDLDYWAAIQEWDQRFDAQDGSATIWTSGRASRIADRYAESPVNMDLRAGLVTADPAEDLELREGFVVTDGSGEDVLFDRIARALRLAARSDISAREILRVHPPSEVNRLCESGPLDVVVFDPRAGSHEAFLGVNWSEPQLLGTAFVERDVSPLVVEQLNRQIRRGGLVPAGRLLGPAGSTRLYRRPMTTRERADFLLRRTKVRTGEAIVHGRQWIEGKRARPGALESRRTSWPGPVPSSLVEEFIDRAEEAQAEWTMPDLPTEPIDDLAREAHDRFGIYPISFSHPKPRELGPGASWRLAPIIPGFPYTFVDEEEYLATYAKGPLGLTHRKAGWDCFRHVEVLAAGSVPLMVDVQDIPRFSMIHYPKSSLTLVLDRLRESGQLPSRTTRTAFREYMLRHLTTEAMARYLLRHSGIKPEDTVVFLDDNLGTNPEYQSTLTAIGLKQVLGPRCVVPTSAEFLYSDSTSDTSRFYGRGFGYTGILDPHLKSTDERQGNTFDHRPKIPPGAVVVLGSVSRNRGLARELLADSQIERIVMIHGEDSPPEREDLDLLRGPQVTGFVRAIHV